MNYEAAIRALMIHFLEEIPTIKALVTRIKQDIRFKLSLGFLYGDRDPSEATFSRILQTLSENIETLERQNILLLKAIDQEFGILEEPVVIDAKAVERINDYLKEHMKLNNSTHYKANIVQTEMLLIQLTYNLKTYAAQRLNQRNF
ncbi:transposase [Vagococcus elongatus]|uniref:transposase n=1 Tax=Vagococcus elongatus TaxID=180344 RepID=UPI00147734C0|nr:transposase [Vagococcus elongatus]